MRLPIRWRLTAAFAVVLAVVLVALGGFVLRRSRDDAIRQIDTELHNRATSTFEAGAVNEQLRRDLLGVSDEHFGQELDASGRAVSASTQLGPRPIAPVRLGLRDATVPTRRERRAVRLLVASRDGRTLLLATALDDTVDELTGLRRLLTIAGLVTLAVGAALAWSLAGAALRPVERLRTAAAEYSSADLGNRLAVPRADDEVRRLAVTLNDMLHRIEQSFEQQQTFVDRASHELRTPLANLSLELELALRGSRDVAAMRSALSSASDETARLDRLASNLLVFARAREPLNVHRESIALDELVRSTVATFGARAAAAGVELRVDAPPTTIAADPVRVRQALTNLLDNSIGVSTAGTSVGIAIAHTQDSVVVTVHDDGPGIPPELGDAVFDPFVRGRRDGPGAGLGLAIVSEVARAHGGRAWTQPCARGATVMFSLARRGGTSGT